MKVGKREGRASLLPPGKSQALLTATATNWEWHRLLKGNGRRTNGHTTLQAEEGKGQGNNEVVIPHAWGNHHKKKQLNKTKFLRWEEQQYHPVQPRITNNVKVGRQSSAWKVKKAMVYAGVHQVRDTHRTKHTTHTQQRRTRTGENTGITTTTRTSLPGRSQKGC